MQISPLFSLLRRHSLYICTGTVGQLWLRFPARPRRLSSSGTLDPLQPTMRSSAFGKRLISCTLRSEVGATTHTRYIVRDSSHRINGRTGCGRWPSDARRPTCPSEVEECGRYLEWCRGNHTTTHMGDCQAARRQTPWLTA